MLGVRCSLCVVLFVVCCLVCAWLWNDVFYGLFGSLCLLLFGVRCLLFVVCVCCLLFGACLFVAWCLLLIGLCVLFTVLCVVCCIVCSLLFVVRSHAVVVCGLSLC